MDVAAMRNQQVTASDYPPVVGFDPRDHHDQMGALFSRQVEVSLEALAEGRKDIRWYRAGVNYGNPHVNYVRIHTDDGLWYYIRLDIFAGMIEYEKFIGQKILSDKWTPEYGKLIEEEVDSWADVFA